MTEEQRQKLIKESEINNKLLEVFNTLDDLLNYFNLKGNKADLTQLKCIDRISIKAKALQEWARQ